MSNTQGKASATNGTRRRKIFAIAAAGIVIGVGTAATLASWNDNEWVTGTTTGTSEFDVAQNRDQSPTDASTWTDHETSDVAGALVFAPDALSLTPGDSVYAPVALQTKAGSIAGNATLQQPERLDEDSSTNQAAVLWDALQYSVKVTESATDCTAASWGTFGESVVDAAAFTAAISPSAQALAADRGSIAYYCFEITLPENPAGVTDVSVLQGLTVEPAWRFAIESTT